MEEVQSGGARAAKPGEAHPGEEDKDVLLEGEARCGGGARREQGERVTSALCGQSGAPSPAGPQRPPKAPSSPDRRKGALPATATWRSGASVRGKRK